MSAIRRRIIDNDTWEFVLPDTAAAHAERVEAVARALCTNATGGQAAWEKLSPALQSEGRTIAAEVLAALGLGVSP